MSHLSNRAPELDNQKAWDWIRPNYQIPSFPDYPSSPTNGYVFKHTVNQHYYQWDTNLTPDAWVDLGPSTGFYIGNIPTGTSPLQISDTNPNHSNGTANLFVVYLTEGAYPAPLLMVDQGLIVKKDLMVGGFVDSGQGALWLNYGLKGRPELSTPPLIEMMSSNVSYPSGSSFPYHPDGWETGQLFNLTSAYYWNGQTYPAGKYMWKGTNWITGNFTGHYDTLFLLKNDGITPAHLDLGILTARSLFSTYTSDGLFSASALPCTVITPNENGKILLGYSDAGMGQYAPRIGFLVNGTPYQTAANASIGLEPSSGLLTIRNGANQVMSIEPSGNLTLTGSHIYLPYAFTIHQNVTLWGSYAQLPVISQGWTAEAGDFLILIGAGNHSNTATAAIQISQTRGILFGNGTDTPGTNLTSTYAQIDRYGNFTLSGSLYGSGGTLNIATDTRISHGGTVFFNVHSADGSAVINLQRGSTPDTKGFLGTDGTSKVYLTSASGLNLEFDANGGVITAKNDFVAKGLIDINAGDNNPKLYFNQNNGATLASIVHDDTSGANIVFSAVSHSLILKADYDILLWAGSGKNVYLWGYRQLLPQTPNTGMIGNHSFWNGSSWVSQSFAEISGTDLYYVTPHDLDSYDDLELVKQWGEPKPAISQKYDPTKKAPNNKDIFAMLKGSRDNKTGEEGNEFLNAGKVSSFALGCAKALAKKQDTYEATLLELFNKLEVQQKEIDSLHLQLQQLTAKGGVSA